LRCHDLAALSWSYGKLKDSAEYQKAPMYFDACQQWHERLSEDDKETCLTLADGHRQHSQGCCRVHRRIAAACPEVSAVNGRARGWRCLMIDPRCQS
jgi:hypothetical protein